MHTFERIGCLLLWQNNWCRNQHGDKPLQSAACTEFEGFTVHYRYVCTEPTLCFVTLCVWYSYSRFITDHKGPQHNIVSRYNSAHIFMTLSLILHCIACCRQTLPIISSLRICGVTCCVSFSQYSIFCSIYFPMQNLIQNFFIVGFFIIFSNLPLFLCGCNCV